MKGLTLERNRICVKHVLKHLVFPDIFENMRKPILEKNPMNVRYVGKPSVPPMFKCMKEFTLERDPINVRNVGKPTFLSQAFTDT